MQNLKYSIIEAAGFNEIRVAAHELGHKYLFYLFLSAHTLKNIIFSLGAYHDGEKDSKDCAASANNIMTPIFGNFNLMILKFSNCSIKAFKNTLFKKK